MKNYLYISREKIDMLLPQVPMEIKKKVSSRIGFNLGILTGEIAEERRSLDHLVNQSETISDYIINNADVGSIDSGSAWVKDELYAYLGHFPEAEKAVFFIGSSQRTNVVLGGSTANLLSQQRSNEVGYGQSYLPYLVDQMLLCVSSGQFLGSLNETTRYVSVGVGHPQDPSKWYELVDKMQDFKREPLIKIEFLAKKLVFRSDGHWASMLGTPVYVVSA